MPKIHSILCYLRLSLIFKNPLICYKALLSDSILVLFTFFRYDLAIFLLILALSFAMSSKMSEKSLWLAPSPGSIIFYKMSLWETISEFFSSNGYFSIISFSLIIMMIVLSAADRLGLP